MIRISTSRQRPAKRAQTPSDKAAAGQVKTFLPPTSGLNSAALRSGEAGGAVVLENFWPTRGGIEPRGGSMAICAAPAAARVLFEHAGSGKFFVATDAGICEFSSISSGTLAYAHTGITSGDFVTYETQTAGGSFLLALNGADNLRTFDGTTWEAVTGVSTPAITGVDTADLSYVWGHRNRVFFIQSGTQSAWYLGVNSIAGVATELPLAGVFRKGGALMAGGTWSSDAGDGMDDRCLFITDAGEVAIYSGSDPGDVNNWGLVGVYELGVPLGRRGILQVAGDVLVATEVGIVPLSAVVSKDPLAIKASAITDNIEPDWTAYAGLASGAWRLTKWDRGNMLIASQAGASEFYAANMLMTAWTKITGWSPSDVQPLGGDLYFCDSSGGVYRGWTGGLDDSRPFVCRACFAFEHLGNPAAEKTPSMVQAVWMAFDPIEYSTDLAFNYMPTFGDVPENASSSDETSSVWDLATWDLADWGGEATGFAVDGWRGVSGSGHALAPVVQIQSQSSGRLRARLQRFDMIYKIGASGA